MEKAHCRGSEESRWWALKFCFKFFQPICPRPPLDLECTSVSGDLHPTPHWLLQPPRLLYDRAASYGSFIILSEGMIFNFQGTVSRFGFLPVWDVALAVTIVYLKTDCLFRMHPHCRSESRRRVCSVPAPLLSGSRTVLRPQFQTLHPAQEDAAGRWS